MYAGLTYDEVGLSSVGREEALIAGNGDDGGVWKGEQIQRDQSRLNAQCS